MQATTMLAPGQRGETAIINGSGRLIGTVATVAPYAAAAQMRHPMRGRPAASAETGYGDGEPEKKLAWTVVMW